MSSSDHDLIPGLSAGLLERYLAGECTSDEAARVDQLLADHPEVADALGAYLTRLDPVGEPAEPDTDQSWDAMRRRMAEQPVVVLRPTVRHPLRWALPAALAAAAVLTVALFATHRPAVQTAARQTRDYTTPVGQTATLALADGTTITMAPGSQLRVAADFGRARRDVYLDGEAYFAVVHDAEHPFTVFAGPVAARDIGTAYAVRHYGDEPSVRVAVRDGRVDVTDAGVVGAGDVVRRAADGTTHVQHGTDVDALLGWTTGRLTYMDAPLADVRADLRRWYGIDIAVGRPAVDTLRFTGTVSGLAAHDVVALLAATLGLHAQWQGSHPTLY
jgi:transmembrane sensor